MAFVTGCEWESSGSDSTWDDSMSWANFSGTYRDADGGALATTFGTSTISGGATQEQRSVTGEILATGDFSLAAYSGTADNTPMVEGSLVINGGALTWTDNGDGTLSGSAGVDGTISYATGAWTIDLKSNRIADNEPITAAYRYSFNTGGGVNEPDQGNTGDPIYILTVTQTGNKLVFTDNTGATYSGSIHSLSAPNGDSTGGTSGAIQGNFEVKGTSSSGAQVTITGSLSGTYTAATDGGTTTTSADITGLKMEATWIEANGASGDIRAVVQ